jgi:hypothetical protein
MLLDFLKENHLETATATVSRWLRGEPRGLACCENVYLPKRMLVGASQEHESVFNLPIAWEEVALPGSRDQAQPGPRPDS